MLTFDDVPIIKRAIMRRIHVDGKTEVIDIRCVHKPQFLIEEIKEPGTDVVVDLRTKKLQDDVSHIQVGIWWMLRDRIREGKDAGLISGKTFFDLPEPWTRQNLHNEIDDTAEQIKKVRTETANSRLIHRPGAVQKQVLSGGSLRRHWPGGISLEPKDRAIGFSLPDLLRK